MNDLALSYIEFLKNIGDMDINKISSYVDESTCSTIKKIINHEEACATSTALSEQLLDVRKMAGKLSIELVNHCNDATNMKCAVRYLLKSELAGDFSTLAIIDYDAAGKIKMIDEIYTQL